MFSAEASFTVSSRNDLLLTDTGVPWGPPSSPNSHLALDLLDLPALGKWKPLLNEIYDLEGS